MIAMATAIREVAPGWVEGSAPEQRVFDGKVFPKILCPAASAVGAAAAADHVVGCHDPDLHEYYVDQDKHIKRSAEDEGRGRGGGAAAAAEEEEEEKDQGRPMTMENYMERLVRRSKAFLEEQLYEHGAVLLRGLPCMRSARDFDALVSRWLGWEEVDYVGAAPRQRVIGRVLTANDSNPHLAIPFHHEMIEAKKGPPPKIIFFCDIEPIHDGETPLVLSHKIEEKMREEFPDFVQKLEEKGVVHVKTLQRTKDSSSFAGEAWPIVFGTTNLKEAEKIAHEDFNARLVWLPDGKVKFIGGPYKAIKVLDEKRGRKQWFNKLSYTDLEVLDDLHTKKVQTIDIESISQDGLNLITFKDGEIFPKDAMIRYIELLKEMSVDIPWKKGDVLIVDNLAVMHGRKPCSTPRKILVALAGY